jgi:iron-sulfur cluster assembly protein
MGSNTNLTLDISDKAVRQFQNIMNDNGIPEGYSLRITVEGSKNEGITYRLGFDSIPKDTDILIIQSGLNILIDPDSAPLLNGTSIDFNEEGCCGGFVFNNPNAQNKCGCHN